MGTEKIPPTILSVGTQRVFHSWNDEYSIYLYRFLIGAFKFWSISFIYLFIFIYFFFYFSMAGCYFSIYYFLFICYLWGAWLHYNTDAQQGEKTSLNLLLIPNQKASLAVFMLEALTSSKTLDLHTLVSRTFRWTWVPDRKSISAYTMFLESFLIMEAKYYFLHHLMQFIGKNHAKLSLFRHAKSQKDFQARILL